MTNSNPPSSRYQDDQNVSSEELDAFFEAQSQRMMQDDEKLPLEKRMQEAGRKIVGGFFMILRSLKLYAIDNDVFTRPLKELETTINWMLGKEPQLSIYGIASTVYLNDRLLRFDRNGLDNANYLLAQLEEKGHGGFHIEQKITRRDLHNFFAPFQPNFQPEDLGISAIQPQRLKKVKAHIQSYEQQELDNTLKQRADRRRYAALLYGRLLQYVRKVYTKERKAPARRSSVRILQELIDLCQGNPIQFLGFSNEIDPDQYQAHHVCNTVLYTIVFGDFLGLQRHQLLELSLATIDHDLGKLDVSMELLKRWEKLSEEEQQQMRNVSRNTTRRILQGPFSTEKIQNALIAWDISQKHTFQLNQSLEEVATAPVSLYSRIISMCACFDALCTRRPYRAKMHPKEALRFMQRNIPEQFDPYLLAHFLSLFRPMVIRSLATKADKEEALLFFAQVQEQPIASYTSMELPTSNSPEHDVSEEPLMRVSQPYASLPSPEALPVVQAHRTESVELSPAPISTIPMSAPVPTPAPTPTPVPQHVSIAQRLSARRSHPTTPAENPFDFQNHATVPADYEPATAQHRAVPAEYAAHISHFQTVPSEQYVSEATPEPESQLSITSQSSAGYAQAVRSYPALPQVRGSQSNLNAYQNAPSDQVSAFSSTRRPQELELPMQPEELDLPMLPPTSQTLRPPSNQQLRSATPNHKRRTEIMKGIGDLDGFDDFDDEEQSTIAMIAGQNDLELPDYLKRYTQETDDEDVESTDHSAAKEAGVATFPGDNIPSVFSAKRSDRIEQDPKFGPAPSTRGAFAQPLPEKEPSVFDNWDEFDSQDSTLHTSASENPFRDLNDSDDEMPTIAVQADMDFDQGQQEEAVLVNVQMSHAQLPTIRNIQSGRQFETPQSPRSDTKSPSLQIQSPTENPAMRSNSPSSLPPAHSQYSISSLPSASQLGLPATVSQYNLPSTDNPVPSSLQAYQKELQEMHRLQQIKERTPEQNHRLSFLRRYLAWKLKSRKK